MQGLGAGSRCVQCVAEITKESIASPSQTQLDVCVQHALAMEEIARCDADGVRCITCEKLVGRKDIRLSTKSNLACF